MKSVKKKFKVKDIIRQIATIPQQSKDGTCWYFYVKTIVNEKEVDRTVRQVFRKNTFQEIQQKYTDVLFQIAEQSKTISKKVKKVKEEKKPEPDSVYLKYVDEAEKLLIEGLVPTVVMDMIKEKRLIETNIKSSPDALRNIIYRANLRIKQAYSKERADIVALHLKRYNTTIKYLYEETGKAIDFTPKEIERRLAMMFTLIETMFAKERLLGIHQKSFKIQINNETEIHLAKQKADQFNLDQLTFEEQKELLELLAAAKLSDFETISVKLKEKEKEEIATAELIQDVEVVSETLNIDQIAKPKEDEVVVTKKAGKSLAQLTRQIEEVANKEVKEKVKQKRPKEE